MFTVWTFLKSIQNSKCLCVYMHGFDIFYFASDKSISAQVEVQASPLDSFISLLDSIIFF